MITVRLCSYSVVKERGGEKGNPSIIGAMVRVFDEDSEFSLWSEDGKPLGQNELKKLCMSRAFVSGGLHVCDEKSDAPPARPEAG